MKTIEDGKNAYIHQSDGLLEWVKQQAKQRRQARQERKKRQAERDEANQTKERAKAQHHKID